MVKQRHIGFTVFSICCAISARLAFFEDKPHVLTAAEVRWGTHEKSHDTLGLIHGLRYYFYVAGVLGLLMVAEDYFDEKKKANKRTNQAL
jgi:hypothetical protein